MIRYAGLITKFSKQEIDQLFKNSKRIFSNDAATILAAPRTLDFARVLLVTPRTIGNAVIRNLLRRRLKSIFYQEKLYQTLTHDIVVIARKPLTTYSFEQLEALLRDIKE